MKKNACTFVDKARGTGDGKPSERREQKLKNKRGEGPPIGHERKGRCTSRP